MFVWVRFGEGESGEDNPEDPKVLPRTSLDLAH